MRQCVMSTSPLLLLLLLLLLFFLLLAPIELVFETTTPPKEAFLPVLVYRALHVLLACYGCARSPLCCQCGVCYLEIGAIEALLGKMSKMTPQWPLRVQCCCNSSLLRNRVFLGLPNAYSTTHSPKAPCIWPPRCYLVVSRLPEVPKSLCF
jgi:hypothetical protein